jgi:hypothetical protein
LSGAAAWRWSLAAGVVMLLGGAAFARIPGLVACGDDGGHGAIIALELARTPADVAALFGTEPCRSAAIAAQRTALWIDALLFIPAYTAVLSLAAWAANRRVAPPIVAALVIAGLADEIEGVLLGQVLAEPPGTQPLLDALFWMVRLKFLLLALATAMIGALLVVRLRWLPVGFGIVVAVAGVQALLGWWALPRPGMMSGFTIGWLVLFVTAALASVWPSAFAPARAHRPRSPAPRSA